VELVHCNVKHPSVNAAIGGYQWRKARDLLTIGDHVRRYRATHYHQTRIPLPEERLTARNRGRQS